MKLKHSEVTVYKARDGWRWRLRAANGRIVAVSGEAFANKWNAERAVHVAYIAFGSSPVQPRIEA